MRLHRLGTALVVLVALDSGIRAQGTLLLTEPYSGATEPGVPFPLPQELEYGRRKVEGGSNALTFSWDGRLIMYADSGAVWNGHTPAGAGPEGYVFAAFDPSKIKLENGRPNFAPTNLPPAIGAPFPRFALVDDATLPDTTGLNNYPTYDPSGSTPIPHYPYIAGTMGELGLLSYDMLSNNMYPAPIGALPSGAYGQNPYPSDANGSPVEFGAYRTYRAYVTFQDLPRFWNPQFHWTGTAWVGRWQGYTIPVTGTPYFEFLGQYPPGQYPNGRSVDASHPPAAMKRNGIALLEITTDPAANTVLRVIVLRRWKPFTLSTPGWTTQSGMSSVVGLGLPSTSTMYADNFEPVLTHDGHLMVGKGSPYLVGNIGQTSRVVFYLNQTAFYDTGWEGPYELTQLYSKRNTVLGPENLTIAERYPISRHPFKDYAGNVLASTDPFEGGYTWLDPDGRFLIYSTFRAGVADGLGTGSPYAYPQCWLAADGGSGSNRAHTSIVGSVTGWQMWRIDHEAENANRHMFTAWDQQSRTTHLRVASLGFSPGFWNVLKGAEGLPLRDDGHLKLQLINSNRLLYYELDLSPYQERDYGFYLPMTELLVLLPSLDPINDPDGVRREVDITRTPDLSGNAHVGIVEGGQLPCEYFGLPTNTNDAPGLYNVAPSPSNIASGWTASDCITVGSGGSTRYWARLADWKDGRDSNMDASHVIDTQAFLGRGDPHDMDSDACWGRVGEAMFFKNATWVRVSNSGSPSELNPGTLGNARGFTASFWINPRQVRTADTAVFQHNFTITLKQNGEIAASLLGTTISSGTTLATVGRWTHVAFTWKDTPAATSSDIALYLDGNQVATATVLRDNLAPSAADIKVGCLATCASTASRVVLLLDEVALKNSALIGQDVVDLALGPVPTKTWDNTNLPVGPAPFVDSTDARVPKTSHYDATIANLGADLFRDVQLSGSKALSCGSCHDPANAFVDGLESATGTIRNTQTIYNQRYQVEQFWDRRALDLEDQVGFPLASPTEMNKSMTDVLLYLSGDADYLARFNSASFTVPGVSEVNFRRAIATYERAVTAGNAPADRYSATNLNVLTANQKLGRALFSGKARCSGCHAGPNFTDGRLWTTGDFRSDGFDDGAFESNSSAITAGRARFKGAFKTPTLRELSRTGPYFHDGRGTTLDSVLDFYEAGGVRQDATYPGYALLDAGHDVVAEEINHRLGLTAVERGYLKEYLLALTTDASSTVNDGPTGNNHVPTVTNVTASYDAATGLVTVSATVQDRYDDPDLDTSMSWTLDVELPVGGTHYHWADASSIAPVTSGYDVTVAEPGHSSGQVRIRAADHHGLWSGWTTVSY